MRTIQTLCIQWPRLGPVHLNRLRAAHNVLSQAGTELVALETASDSSAYAWRIERAETPYRRYTVFPGRNYDDISPDEMHVEVVRALDQIRPNAVHIHSYSTPDARACLEWCRRNRRVAICMAESREKDAERNPLREWFKRLLVSQFDAAQASGRESASYAAKLGIPRGRITLGYSVVDNDYFAEQAAAARANHALTSHLPGLDDETPFFFASARFMERKNLDDLLLAYKMYRHRSDAPWRLILLGDGELRPRLESIVRSEAIDRVELPGWRQIDELPLYYGRASAFVHTAQTDQWGLVVNEAMAAGLPVIVSSGTGAASELVADGVNGFTFTPGDVGTLADRLYMVAHEVDRESFARAAKEIIAEWPLKRFGTSLLDAAKLGASGDIERRPGLAALSLIWLMRKLARAPRSFHAIQD